jgi:S-methylmethionine-dependent homocysteine/selenocysteine methylase
MPKYRHDLPQLKGGLFLSDGGLETTLIFHDGMDLPYFASFPLVATEKGRAQLDRYFAPYLETARQAGLGFILGTATWRANRDWGEKLGYTPSQLDTINHQAVEALVALRARHEDAGPFVIEGAIGPRGDGYRAELRMTPAEAQAYHGPQVRSFAQSDADMVAAFTLNYVDEAIGIVRAAKAADMPVAISFTVETDGRLPSGETLREAVERVDRETHAYPVYFMINCAHPQHFDSALKEGAWLDRIRGIRANASTKSHAELDASTEIDIGDIDDLARRHGELRNTLRRLAVIGGCCGTDHRHIAAIAHVCLEA